MRGNDLSYGDMFLTQWSAYLVVFLLYVAYIICDRFFWIHFGRQTSWLHILQHTLANPLHYTTFSTSKKIIQNHQPVMLTITIKLKLTWIWIKSWFCDFYILKLNLQCSSCRDGQITKLKKFIICEFLIEPLIIHTSVKSNMDAAQ